MIPGGVNQHARRDHASGTYFERCELAEREKQNAFWEQANAERRRRDLEAQEARIAEAAENERLEKEQQANQAEVDRLIAELDEPRKRIVDEYAQVFGEACGLGRGRRGPCGPPWAARASWMEEIRADVRWLKSVDDLEVVRARLARTREVWADVRVPPPTDLARQWFALRHVMEEYYGLPSHPDDYTNSGRHRKRQAQAQAQVSPVGAA